jgi:hypothetical protein
VREWQVSGVASAAEAIASVPATVGSTHPLDATLVVRSGGIGVRFDSGPKLYVVTASYSRPGGSGWGASPSIDDPDTLTISTITREEPSDYDAFGNAVTNSALDPFDQSPMRVFTSVGFTVAKSRSSFNIAAAIGYVGKINSDNFTVPGVGTMLPGECMCVGINASQSYTSGSIIRVSYEFEARERYALGGGQFVTGFALRVKDTGLQCMGPTAGTRVDIVYKSGPQAGMPVQTPVFLDGSGRVKNSNAYAPGKIDGTSATTTLNSNIKKVTTADGTFLYYTMHAAVSFAGIFA